MRMTSNSNAVPTMTAISASVDTGGFY
jgi:hypothetical protein